MRDVKYLEPNQIKTMKNKLNIIIFNKIVYTLIYGLAYF